MPRSEEIFTRLLVRPGWSLAEIQPDSPDLQPMGQRLMVPSAFELHIQALRHGDGEEAWFISLYFEVSDSQIHLRGLLANPMEVHEALDYLREHGGIDGWKRTALTSLAADAAQEVADEAGLPRDDQERRMAITRAMKRAASTPVSRRRNRVTDGLLREVASIYRETYERGGPPTKTVSEHFKVSHSTAARWVGQARGAGHLGAADGSRGGER